MLRWKLVYKLVNLLWIGLLLSSCSEDDPGEQFFPAGIQYDEFELNIDLPTFDLPANYECISIDLNNDNNNDIEFCINFSTTLGSGMYENHYIKIKNNTLKIATTATFDSIHQCIEEQNSTFYPQKIYKRMQKLELPSDSLYSVKAFDDQGYPTIIDHYNLISDDLNYTNTVKILHTKQHTSNPVNDTDLKREYWKNIGNKYMAYKIEKDEQIKQGWIRLSSTRIFAIGLEKG